jgi:hypothetical protein
MRLFVSYHTPDAAITRRVADMLQATRADLEVFFAPREMTAGGLWLPRLADELAKSDALLFIAGNRIGPWQEIEYFEAHRLGRKAGPGSRPQIIPVVISDHAPGLPFFELLHQIYAKDPATPETIAAICRALDGVTENDPTPKWVHFNPYKGLPAFTSSDSAFFFGREQITSEILERLINSPDRVLALIGKSGVGKSSIAQAGIMAALRSQIWPDAKGSSPPWPTVLDDSRDWALMVLRPEDQPLRELARQFLRLAISSAADLEVEAGKWARILGVDPEPGGPSRLDGLLRGVKSMLAEAGVPAPSRYFLYVDQGEEIYSRNKPEVAERFAALLADTAQRSDCHVMLSLRSDYYGDLQADQALFAQVAGDGGRRTISIDVPPLDQPTLQAVIERPSRQFGVRFLPESLPKIIAVNASREAGSLPLVSYLLSDMWSGMQARADGVLRWDETPELFELTAPLRERAERYVRKYADALPIVRRLFTLRLALLPRDGDAIKRRAREGECSKEEWENAERLAGQEWRLITIGQDAGEATAEVAHEQILRKWPRLTEWLDERRAFLSWKTEIEVARQDHEATPDPEKALALLSGRALLIARQWRQSTANGDDIGKKERDFIDASIARHDAIERQAHEAEFLRIKEREVAARKIARRTTIGMISASAFACIAVAVAIWAYHAYQLYRDEQQMRIAAEAAAKAESRETEAMRTDIAGQLSAYAASVGQNAMDGTSDNSPYTASLLQALQDKKRSLFEALQQTNQRVLEETAGQQRPFLSSDMNGNVFLWNRPPTRRMFALIIYSDYWEGQPTLRNPSKDSEAWAALLKQVGVPFEQLKNPSSAAVKDALRRLGSSLAPKQGQIESGLLRKVALTRIQATPHANTIGLFIYSGFGAQIDGINRLPLWDATPTVSPATSQANNADKLVAQIKEKSITVNDISSSLRENSAASVVVLDTSFPVLDAPIKR